MKLDRRALADAIRHSPEFGALTRQIAKKAERTAAALADQRVRRRTGHYVGGFETTVTLVSQINTLARLRLFNTVKHAAIIEDGSRPHVIRPRRARILAFDVNGRQVFANVVHHPGTRPQHIVRDALRKVASGAS